MMKLPHILPLLVLLLISTPCSAQRQHGALPSTSGGPLSAEQAAYDVRFYDIHLSIHPDDQRIEGFVDVHVGIEEPIDHILLDLDDRMDVASVAVRRGSGNWEAAEAERRAGQLAIPTTPSLRTGEQLAVRVEYGGEPVVAPNPPWIGGFTWATTSDGRPWIATSVQMDGADLWLPVKDHPSDKPDSVQLHITVPEGLTVASNGILRDHVTRADSSTFIWFTGMPISNYNIALNIAPYAEVEDSYESADGTTVPVTFWVLPERLEDGRRMLPQFIDHVRWYEELLGPYPFRTEKYGVAHTPHLGMEHQTIIAYGSTFSNNEWGYDWLHHHELGHEWWANLVTAPDWNDFWIHEGFCTYMQPLYVEHLHGQASYLQEMAAMRRHLNNLRPVAPREPMSTSEMYFVEGQSVSDNDIYYKGAWALHTLRYLIGDEAFFASMRRFAYPDEAAREATDGSQVRFVTTEEYRQLAERIAGRDLGWFFEVYLRRAELPRLHLQREAGSVSLSWETPDDLHFPMPIDLDIDGERRRVTVDMDGVVLDVPPGASITVDPDGWVLRAETG